MSASLKKSGKSRCRIRPFSVPDLDAVLKVETDSFAFPWSREMFITELKRGRISRCFIAEIVSDAPAVDSMGTAHGRGVAGYIMSLLVVDELYITNLAVSPACRRSGVASDLIKHAIEDACTAGAVWCQLEVRSTNNAARALYRDFGFRKIGVRKGYYQDGEDAVVLGRELST